MKGNKLVNCPICRSNKEINILDLNCGNLDNSTLYQSVKINVCTECGHIYNRLSLDEIDGLTKYYNEEYAPLNLSSTDTIGDRPGSNNPFTYQRHTQLYNLISSYVNNDSKVLDVGCAMGGFLDFLHAKGLDSLHGVDVIEDYVNYAKKKGDYNIKLGSAESIPFEDNSFDLLVLDQVLEHLVEPVKAFREAKRVLVDGGLFCIGVPDASRYDKIYFFDFYWFLMREHLQHFDVEHLKLLAEIEGFELVSVSKTETAMMNENMLLPNLNVICRLTGNVNKMEITQESFTLKKEIEKYLSNELESLKNRKVVIERLIKSKKPVFAWGIGREFLYLYESAGLKYCNIVGLIDANPHKQKNFILDGKKIMDRTILSRATPDSVLIIAAIAHTDLIEKELKDTGYSGEVLAF